MNKYSFLKPVLLPVVLGLVLSAIYLLPSHGELAKAAIAEQLPLGAELDGWIGSKRQESDKEREALAVDTVFNKADYIKDSGAVLTRTLRELPCSVSIVFSGSDMNNSIHRPERCLPAQGHENLHASKKTVKLNNGREIVLTRLASMTRHQEGKLYYIHYYVFIGNHTVTEDHLERTWIDMRDRVLEGRVQSWAYIQLGSYYGDLVGTSEEETDRQLVALIQDLLPQIIKWDQLKD